MSLAYSGRLVLQEGHGNPFSQDKKHKQKGVTKYHNCLTSSIVYHHFLSVIRHFLPLTTVCHSLFSIVRVISRCLAFAHWLLLPIVCHTPLFGIPHCLQFYTVCSSPLSVIHHCLAFSINCSSPPQSSNYSMSPFSLFIVWHSKFPVIHYYTSFAIVCHHLCPVTVYVTTPVGLSAWGLGQN